MNEEKDRVVIEALSRLGSPIGTIVSGQLNPGVVHWTGRAVEKPRGWRLIPWALFGNADDPQPPAEYLPRSPLWWRRIAWWFRNPLHNGCFYVWGVMDRDSESAGDFPDRVFAPDGWNRVRTTPSGSWPRPFVSHRGKTWRWYIGWRSPGGAFGLKFQRNRDDT
jgi:hypothetical protein